MLKQKIFFNLPHFIKKDKVGENCPIELFVQLLLITSAIRHHFEIKYDFFRFIRSCEPTGIFRLFTPTQRTHFWVLLVARMAVRYSTPQFLLKSTVRVFRNSTSMRYVV